MLHKSGQDTIEMEDKNYLKALPNNVLAEILQNAKNLRFGDEKIK